MCASPLEGRRGKQGSALQMHTNMKGLEEQDTGLAVHYELKGTTGSYVSMWLEEGALHIARAH